jgi:hypothetical protein
LESENTKEARHVGAIYELSGQGRIGWTLKTISDAMLEFMQTEGGEAVIPREALIPPGLRRNHLYRISDKRSEGADTVVRFEYLGQEK